MSEDPRGDYRREDWREPEDVEPPTLRAILEQIHKPQDGLRRLNPLTREVTEQICEECDRPWPCATKLAIEATARASYPPPLDVADLIDQTNRIIVDIADDGIPGPYESRLRRFRESLTRLSDPDTRTGEGA